MEQVTADFIAEQIVAGCEPIFLAVESIGVSAMDYSGEVERGCIYKPTMWKGDTGQIFISFYNYNDTKLEPLTINYTNICSNLSIKKGENQLLSRLFRLINDLDELVTSVIEDGHRAMPNKKAKMINAFSQFFKRGEYEFFTEKDGAIILDAKVRHYPIIARHFNNFCKEQGLKKYLVDWHIDADLAEFVFYK